MENDITDQRSRRWGVVGDDGSQNTLAASLAHAQLRAQILSGELAAGTVMSQVGLAAELGISRTPVREALRMLQEEGLVESEPNRRCRVAGFDPVDLDATYGTRLMLEALGMRMTLPGLRPAQLSHAGRRLDELEALGGPAAGDAWHRAHHDFHQTFVSGAPRQVVEQIASHAQRSERYMNQQAHAPSSSGTRRAAEHRQIHQHVCDGELDDAIIASARHLVSTPLILLAEVASEVEPTAIRAALSMIIALKPDGVSQRRARRSSA